MKLSLIFGGLAALAAVTANGVSENKALGGIVPRGVEAACISVTTVTATVTETLCASSDAHSQPPASTGSPVTPPPAVGTSITTAGSVTPSHGLVTDTNPPPSGTPVSSPISSQGSSLASSQISNVHSTTGTPTPTVSRSVSASSSAPAEQTTNAAVVLGRDMGAMVLAGALLNGLLAVV